MGTISGDGTAVTGLGGAEGYGETALPRGDEVFAQADVSAVFEAGFVLDGTVYRPDQLFISTDGFVTFGAGVAAAPADPASLTVPFLAIFMADVDTRTDGEAPESGPIWLDVDPLADCVTITWQDVGFYRRDAGATDTFQMQLYDRGGGAMDVVYRFDSIDWTTGDLQGGSGGLGGTPAFIGYREAAAGTVTGLPASGDGAAELALPTSPGNTGVPGLFVFRLGGSTAAVLGSSGNDTLQGSPGADLVQGLGGDDWIFASGGADTVDGGAGLDALDFSAAPAGLVLDLANAAASSGWAKGLLITGIESFIGSSLTDRLLGGTGNDWFDGWSGNDSLSGAGGSDSLYGNTGSDTLTGGGAADSLVGGDGSDVLDGGAGADWLDGGGGADLASYASASEAVRVDLGDPGSNLGFAKGDLLTGVEQVLGSSFNDTLVGQSGTPTLYGGAGNDSLQGLAGTNALYGGSGRDSVMGAKGADLLSGDAGNDLLVGGNGDDRLSGGNGADTLQGGDGADTLDGGAGTDRADYSAANAAILLDLAAPGNSTGWARGDVLTGIEIVTGTGFADTLGGSAAADALYGGDGDDVLSGLSGDNTLGGDAGNDTLTGGADSDSLLGGGGGDSLAGGDGGDTLLGGSGADQLDGGTGKDSLWGGDGNDRLGGGGGADTLSGDAGSDTLSGGVGADVFAVTGANGQGADLIADYDAGQGDVLQIGISGLQAADFILTQGFVSGAGLSSVAEVMITLAATGEVLWVLQDGADLTSFLVQSSIDTPFSLM